MIRGSCYRVIRRWHHYDRFVSHASGMERHSRWLAVPQYHDPLSRRRNNHIIMMIQRSLTTAALSTQRTDNNESVPPDPSSETSSHEAKIAKLVRKKQYDNACQYIDRLNAQGPLPIHLYHPLIAEDTIESLIRLLIQHKAQLDYETFRNIVRLCQSTSRQRLLLTLEDGMDKTDWTSGMFLELMKGVWPAQAKRYFHAHILPTNKKMLIRQAVEVILWKYRVVISKCRPTERGELYDTVRIARHFYEQYADPLKGT